MTKRTLQEVAEAVNQRRRELNLTELRLRSITGVDRKTMQALLEGTRWPQEETRIKVEAALDWAAGSIQAVRDGGDPTVLQAVDIPPEEEGSGPHPWAMQALAIRPIAERFLDDLERTGVSTEHRALDAGNLAQLAFDYADFLFQQLEKEPHFRAAYAEAFTEALLTGRRLLALRDDLMPASERIGEVMDKSLKAAYGFNPEKEKDDVVEIATQSAASTETVENEEAALADKSDAGQGGGDRLDAHLNRQSVGIQDTDYGGQKGS